MSAPASPPARRRRVPSWLDLRFVLGVVLVLASVAGGARLFATADRTVPVWAVTGDLASGTVLARVDLVAVRVRLPESGERYLAANGPPPVGRSLSRDLGSGELLPRAALVGRACGSEVSIPVAALHVPGTVRRGARVDVFATPRAGRTTRVLAAVTVQDVVRGSDLGGGSALVVRVADGLAPATVRAVRTADIDVVVVDGRTAGDGCGASPSASQLPAEDSPPTVGAGEPAPGPSPVVPSAGAGSTASPNDPDSPLPDGSGSGSGDGDVSGGNPGAGR